MNHWQTKEYGHPTHTVSIMRLAAWRDPGLRFRCGELPCIIRAARALPPNSGGGCLRPDGLVEGVRRSDCCFLAGAVASEYFVEDGGHMAPLFRALIDEARQDALSRSAR